MDKVTKLGVCATAVLGLVLPRFLNATEVTTIFTPGPQKKEDASHVFFVDLATIALAKSGGNYIIELSPYAGQGRTIELMAQNKTYDFLWSASSTERYEKLLQVKFPLFKGGLGWRGSIIRNEFSGEFSRIRSIKELSKYVACQGLHWPDADILTHAGLAVQRMEKFDDMVKMLDSKRCDYLPLSLFEGRAELALIQHRYPDLVFSTALILHYPLVMNFYVRPDYPQLATDLLVGLKKMETESRVLDYLKRHTLTKSAFPLSQFEDSTILDMENSEFTEHQQLDNFALHALGPTPHN